MLAVGALSQAWAADITKGHTFTDGDTAFAGDFNDLLDLATINSSFFTGKSATTTPASGDTLLEYNAAAGDFRKVTLGNLLLGNTALITGQTEDTSPATNDFLLSYDTSASGFKKVALATVRALTYRLEIATNKALGTAYNFNHSLGGAPQIVRCVIVCTNTGGSSGYALNDEVPIEALQLTTGGSAIYTVTATYAAGFGFVKLNITSSAMKIMNPSGSSTALTAADWNAKIYMYYFPP